MHVYHSSTALWSLEWIYTCTYPHSYIFKVLSVFAVENDILLHFSDVLYLLYAANQDKSGIFFLRALFTKVK